MQLPLPFPTEIYGLLQIQNELNNLQRRLAPVQAFLRGHGLDVNTVLGDGIRFVDEIRTRIIQPIRSYCMFVPGSRFGLSHLACAVLRFGRERHSSRRVA